MFRVQLTDVSKRYDGPFVPDRHDDRHSGRRRTVLDRVSLTVRPGDRLGVVGDNGSGKSTLLRLLTGLETADNGTVTVESPGGIGHLAQTLDLPPTATVGDAVDHVLADVRELERAIRAAEAELAETGDLAGYAELLAAHEARGGPGADRRVETTLRRLGERGPLDRTRPLGTLSGGQRSRLALAAVLAAEPELLLLDEPTNDLDDEAVTWLEERLRAHRARSSPSPTTGSSSIASPPPSLRSTRTATPCAATATATAAISPDARPNGPADRGSTRSGGPNSPGTGRSPTRTSTGSRPSRARHRPRSAGRGPSGHGHGRTGR